MSHLEQKFTNYLGKHPEIRAAQRYLNVRAVARSFKAEEEIGAPIEAIVAMIRRADIAPVDSFVTASIFPQLKISTKDEISILGYAKSKDVVAKLGAITSGIDSDKNETLKIVVGTHSIRVIVDSSKKDFVISQLGESGLSEEIDNVTEASLVFSGNVIEQKGTVAFVTNQLLLEGINIREIITCTPELIVYVDEDQSLKAHEIFKRIKKI